jgi:hypothetical protein
VGAGEEQVVHGAHLDAADLAMAVTALADAALERNPLPGKGFGLLAELVLIPLISFVLSPTSSWVRTRRLVWSSAASKWILRPPALAAPRRLSPSTATARRAFGPGWRRRSASQAPTARSSASASRRARVRRMDVSHGTGRVPLSGQRRAPRRSRTADGAWVAHSLIASSEVAPAVPRRPPAPARIPGYGACRAACAGREPRPTGPAVRAVRPRRRQAERRVGQGRAGSEKRRRQARTSVGIIGLDTHMILEARACSMFRGPHQDNPLNPRPRQSPGVPPARLLTSSAAWPTLAEVALDEPASP